MEPPLIWDDVRSTFGAARAFCERSPNELRPEDLEELIAALAKRIQGKSSPPAELRDLRDTARAMSQENVELVRTWYQQFPALNSEALDFLYEQVWDPAIDWRAMAGAPDDFGPIEGRDAMRRYFEELLEIFEDIVWEAEEIIDGGGDRVVVVLRMTGRARLSGVETELRFAILCMLRDGRIVWGREYATKEESLEAAGLSEQDAHP